MCPVPAHASLPHAPSCVCQGIYFCAILNNSIFIGPTKTYHPLPAHTPPVCAPSPLPRGSLPSVPFPCPCLQHPCFPPQKSPCLCDAQPARGEGRGAARASWGHPGDTPGDGQRWGGPAGYLAGSNQRKSLAVPSCGLVTPGSRGGEFLYFISVMSRSQSLAHPCTTRKRRLKTSPWLCFFQDCLRVQSRVRDQLSFPCVASAALPWVLQWAAAPCPWGRSGSHTLWLH